jgi:hypothetical protein
VKLLSRSEGATDRSSYSGQRRDTMTCRSRRSWFAAAAVLLLPATAWAQQTYQIKLKEPDRGAPALYRKVARFREDTTAAEGKNKPAPAFHDEHTQALTFRQEVLEQPTGAGKRLKLRRQYSRAEQGTGDKDNTSPYEGKVIYIEEKGGRYHFRTEPGEKLSEEHAAELQAEFANPLPPLPAFSARWLPPTGAVKVGESWKIDPSFFHNASISLRTARTVPGQATVAGTLLRTYRKGARQYGVFELRIEVPVKILPDFILAQTKHELKRSKFLFRMVADACIDGSGFDYRLKGTIEGNIEGIVANRRRQVQFRVRFLGDLFESREAAVKE